MNNEQLLFLRENINSFIEKIIPIKNNIPTGQKSSGAPEKLWRQLESPRKLNIPRCKIKDLPNSLIGFSAAKIEIGAARPIKSWGFLRKQIPIGKAKIKVKSKR